MWLFSTYMYCQNSTSFTRITLCQRRNKWQVLEPDGQDDTAGFIYHCNFISHVENKKWLSKLCGSWRLFHNCFWQLLMKNGYNYICNARSWSILIHDIGWYDSVICRKIHTHTNTHIGTHINTHIDTHTQAHTHTPNYSKLNNAYISLNTTVLLLWWPSLLSVYI